MGADDSLLTLEKYAIMKRALRSAPDAKKAEILSKHGVTAAQWDRANSHWTAALEKDEGELLLRWSAAREAADAHALKEAAAAAAPAAPPSSEAAAVVEEAPPSAAPVERVKPSFLIERSAPPPLSEAHSRWAAQPYAAPAPAPPQPVSAAEQAGQTISVANIRGLLEPLPFEAARPGQKPNLPPQPEQSVVSKAGETVSVANIRDFLEPLPFDGKPARPARPPLTTPKASAPVPQPVVPTHGSSSHGNQGPQQTVDVDTRALRAALPFLGDAAKAAPAKPTPARPAPPAPAEEVALTPLEPPAPPPPHGAFTLEQYAAFYAELSVYREWAAHVRARYGMTDDARWRSLQQTWQEQFRRDPSLYARWHELHARYEQWFARARAAQR